MEQKIGKCTTVNLRQLDSGLVYHSGVRRIPCVMSSKT